MTHFTGPLLEPTQLTELLSELIRRRSDFPEATEAACCGYVAEVLNREGICHRVVEAAPDRPNIYATLDGGRDGPTIILNGHLDVVPAGEDSWTHSPFEPVVCDGRVFGRGAADMKGGVASCLYAAIALKRSGAQFNGRLVLFFSVDEERTNLGMRQFMTETVDADFAIIAEPTENALHIGHRGVSRAVVRTHGTPEHVARAQEPDNAIEKMAVLVGALTEYRKSLAEKRHPVLGPASGGVTLIKGGTWGNIVPGACEITVDRRLLPGETKEGVMEEIEAALRGHDVDHELEMESWLASSIVAEDHPMVQNLRDVVVQAGGSGEVGVFPATCEAPFFTLDKGIPAVIFGPGSIAQAHVVDEFISMEEVLAHCGALIRFISGQGQA